MNNNKRRFAKYSDLTTLFRTVRQSRGRVDLYALEDDLADFEERFVPVVQPRPILEERRDPTAEWRRERERKAA